MATCSTRTSTSPPPTAWNSRSRSRSPPPADTDDLRGPIRTGPALYGHGRPDRIDGIGAAGSAAGDASGFQHVGAYGRSQRESDVRLDEEHRKASRPGETDDHPLDVGDDVRLDALGRLVEDEQAG